jgi:hypothetical protein
MSPKNVLLSGSEEIPLSLANERGEGDQKTRKSRKFERNIKFPAHHDEPKEIPVAAELPQIPAKTKKQPFRIHERPMSNYCFMHNTAYLLHHSFFWYARHAALSSSQQPATSNKPYLDVFPALFSDFMPLFHHSKITKACGSCQTKAIHLSVLSSAASENSLPSHILHQNKAELANGAINPPCHLCFKFLLRVRPWSPLACAHGSLPSALFASLLLCCSATLQPGFPNPGCYYLTALNFRAVSNRIISGPVYQYAHCAVYCWVDGGIE